jgi:hypothetical protein
MTSPTKMLFAAVALGAGLSGTGVVYAADDATLNHCWGQVTKEFQAFGEPGLGEHANAASPFTPSHPTRAKAAVEAWETCRKKTTPR